MLTITPEIEPIFAALLAEVPDLPRVMTREPWSYADALAAADEAIIQRAQSLPKKRAAKKAPAKKAAARKGDS